MPSEEVNIRYSKRRQGETLVSGCEEGEFIFSGEQDCCEERHDCDFLDCLGDCNGGGILSVSEDCKSLKTLTYDELKDQIDTNDKVRISKDDPCAQYLGEKIVDSDVIKRVESTSGRCKTMKANIDTQALVDQLQDSIEDDDDNDCFDCNQMVKPMAKLYLATDYEVTMTSQYQRNDSTKGRRAFPTVKGRDNNGQNRSDWISFDSITSKTIDGYFTALKINKSGNYLVSLGFNADANWGVQAMRGCVLSTDPDQSVLIDVKDIGEIAGYSRNRIATDADQLRQQGFHGSAVRYLKKGTKVYMGCRIDPYVGRDDPDDKRDVKVIIRRAGLVSGVLNEQITLQDPECGAFVELSWHSTSDGEIMYK